MAGDAGQSLPGPDGPRPLTGVAEGGCRCGAVRYRLLGAPRLVNACHCRDCQRLTGAAFALNGVVGPQQIEVISGRPSEDGSETRCIHCHVLLWATHPKMADVVFLRLGTLDEGERHAPDAHFFIRSKHPWIVLPPGIPAYDTLPSA